MKPGWLRCVAHENCKRATSPAAKAWIACNHSYALARWSNPLYHGVDRADYSKGSVELRQFNTREADWRTDGNQLSNIRRLVFIVEQKVPKDEEWDGKDEDSWHWLATDTKDVPIGTARLLPDGQIGRMAVLSHYRKFGVGAALLEQAVEKARHLGFSRVFLNAQSHALGFYERAGFIAQGEEFQEAGIAHYRMTQTLTPPEDNIQRRLAVESSLDVAVKSFDTSEVLWVEKSSTLRRIRRQIFQTEQKQPDYKDSDDLDDSAIHWIATNDDDHVIGLIRMTPEGIISRFGILEDHSHPDVDTSLLELAIQRARRFSLTQVFADREFAGKTNDFLVKAGFRVDPNTSRFLLTLEPEDRTVQTPSDGGAAMDSDVTYKLGDDKQLIQLRSESDFRNVILNMTSQAKRSIRIYSPLLSHDLFDHDDLMTICSGLGRRNKFTKIEILVFNPHRMIKNGHALLNIARKLPSSIRIKIVDPEMRQQYHEYVLVDGQGVIYRGEHDTYSGTARFQDITGCNHLDRQFTASWESGLLDPNLRQLSL
ncbi:MAG: GNAT family N-acetyltransferase [Gammaproteobacteria bacterium]|nr:GNAT family N-acetyltransferase [Gammaproteobacteria bacterium]